MAREASAASAASMPSRAKSPVSRSSIGAVRWLIPTASSRTSEVVAPSQEVPDRNEIEEDDHEPDRGEPRRAAPVPSDRAAREQRERVHAPAQERHEDRSEEHTSELQ